MESDADLVAATAVAGGTILLRGSGEWNRTRKIVAATAAAGRRSNPGQSLQRFSSLTPEIRNHCTQEVVNGHNLAVIPKFTP